MGFDLPPRFEAFAAQIEVRTYAAAIVLCRRVDHCVARIALEVRRCGRGSLFGVLFTLALAVSGFLELRQALFPELLLTP